MKKVLIFTIILIVVCFAVLANLDFLGRGQLYTREGIESLEDSQNLLYKDILVTLLSPYIHSAIEEYYGEPYSYDLWDIEILNIARPNGYRTFEFLIDLRVKPFAGAHNTVGIDDITIRIASGEAKVEKFQHIEGFELPPWLQ